MRAIACGDPVRYVDGANVEHLAFARTTAGEGAPIDLVWPNVAGAVATLTIVLTVPHVSTVGAPYWTEV